jgi:carbamoyltransferase
MSQWYLGLSTTVHDPALALVDAEGTVRFAEATERFLQDKRAWGVTPDHAPHLGAALDEAGFDRDRDTLRVGTSWASVKGAMGRPPHDALLSGADTLWMQAVQTQMQAAAGLSLLRLGLAREPVEPLRFDHHLCHAVTAAWFAPCDDAVCVVLDGEGEVGAVSAFDMRARRLTRRWRSWGPGSLGTFYGWLTGLCGFDWRAGEEWKVMGLAAFGQVDPELAARMDGMIAVDRGRLRFADEDMLRTADALCRPFGRNPAEPVERAADLAATGQAAYSAFADRVIGSCMADGAATDLLLAGGCALNSSYNGTLPGRHGIERLHVPPCPADDGNAIGAALLAYMHETGTDAVPRGNGSPFLGHMARTRTLDKMRASAKGFVIRETGGMGGAARAVAGCLAEGRILGVMRGRAEFGPRALGHRSILADPQQAGMKDRINAEVKGREAYRPFAPALRLADTATWFGRSVPSPYMSLTLPWLSDRPAPVAATVHADGTGRLQTVEPHTAPWMSTLLGALEQATGVPVVLNTSFNIMGKPIVHSVEDAAGMLMTSGLDAILVEDTLIEKPLAAS